MRPSLIPRRPLPAPALLLFSCLLSAITALPARAQTTHTVTNTNDSNTGSLRQALIDASPGDTITFAPTLSGATIPLISEITITKNVTIDASTLPDGVTISGRSPQDPNPRHRIFTVNAADTTLRGLTFTQGGNASGAAILNNFGNPLTVDRCTFHDNNADNTMGGDDGGAIQSGGGLVITNSTFTNNSADDAGEAIRLNGGVATIIHTTISGNGSGSAIFVGLDSPSPNPVLNLANSIVADNGGAAVTTAFGGTFNDTGGNFTATGALLAPLGDYGGPTMTMHPLPGSPVIDRVNNLVPVSLTDQRGFPRAIDGNEVPSVKPDSGAVEAGNPGPSLVVDTATDENDGITAGDISLRDALAFPAASTITFDPAVFTGGAANTITLTNGQLLIDRQLTVDASALPEPVTIDANQLSRVLEVTTAGGEPIDITTPTGTIATQSSNFTGQSFPASLGIDGNTTNFTHTSGDANDSTPNWTADFQRDLLLGSLVIHNRDDGFQERLSDITVQLLDDADNVLFTSAILNPGNVLGGPETLTLVLPQGILARKVKISRDSGGATIHDRVLSIGELEAFAPPVSLDSLVITGGKAPDGVGDGADGGDGGGIFNNGGNLTLSNTTVSHNTTGNGTAAVVALKGGRGGYGGGIFNAGTLFLVNTTVSHNATGNGGDGGVGRNGGFGGDGGGIFNNGGGTFSNTTVSHNTTGNGGDGGVGGGIGGGGGGISISGTGTLALHNSTLSGNSTGIGGVGGIGGIGGLGGFGGGIRGTGIGTLALHHSTLSGNSSGTGSGTGGGIYHTNALTLENTVVAGNTATDGPDISRGGGGSVSLSTAGANLVSDLSGFMVDSGPPPIVAADPLLAPLGHYGGPVQTMHPLAGSPLIDAAGTTDPGPSATDARGFDRFVDGDNDATDALDIGAVEAGPVLLVDEVADENGSTGPMDTSLREALAAANAAPVPGQRILFDPTVFPATITLTNGQLTTTATTPEGLTIDASGIPGGVTIDANQLSRVMRITSGHTVALHSLTLTNGKAPDGGTSNGEDGGGILNDGGILTLSHCTLAHNTSGDGGDGVGGGGGGGIASDGILTLTDCTLSHNATGDGGDGGGGPADNGGPGGDGGGIASDGILTLTDCTLSHNATGDGGGGPGDRGGGGGGISISGTGSLTLHNSTLSGNSTGVDGSGTGGTGGGISANGVGTLALHHSTLSGNSSGNGSGSGGGIYHTNAVTLENTVVAGNTATDGPDIRRGGGESVSLSTTGANLVSDNTGFTIDSGPAPLVAADPLLAPLGDYGGPTQTRLPLPGSAAIDVTEANAVAATDQRGFPRPQGTHPDLGAVETYTGAGFTDTDMDLMDDRLEPLYGFIVGVQDGHLDADLDGSTNAQELGNKTDPRNGADVFQILDIQFGTGYDAQTNRLFNVTFKTFPGLSYSFEAQQNLNFGGPGTEEAGPINATGFTHTEPVLVTPPFSLTEFLRIRRN